MERAEAGDRRRQGAAGLDQAPPRGRGAEELIWMLLVAFLKQPDTRYCTFKMKACKHMSIRHVSPAAGEWAPTTVGCSVSNTQ